MINMQELQVFIDNAQELTGAVDDAKRHVKEIELQLADAEDVVKKAEGKIAYQMSKLRKLLPKEFYSRDIDHGWKFPKKYTVTNVTYENGRVYVTVKWEYKKKPWVGFDPRHCFRLEEFLTLNIGATYNAAIEAWQQRPCPKCGQPMGDSERSWCEDCMTIRDQKISLFHTLYPGLYDEEDDCIYDLEYVDELTRRWGYSGAEFIVKRLDTGEIIKTNNIYSAHSSWAKNLSLRPRIQFIKYDGRFVSPEYTEEQFADLRYAHEIVNEMYETQQAGVFVNKIGVYT